jgi:hypothetical protein
MFTKVKIMKNITNMIFKLERQNNETKMKN